MSYRFLSSWENETREHGCTWLSLEPVDLAGRPSVFFSTLYRRVFTSSLRFLWESRWGKIKNTPVQTTITITQVQNPSRWQLSCMPASMPCAATHSWHVLFLYDNWYEVFFPPLCSVSPLSPEANVLARPVSGSELTSLTRHGEHYPTSTQPLWTACLPH